jgi:hypothetical protein
MSKYLTILLISIFTLSCSKDESSEVDLKNTQISISKPVENLPISKGDTLHIEAIITSDVSMHGYEIIIHDIASKTQQSIINKHTHGKQISVKQSWNTSNETLGEKEVEVVAIIEHTGLKTSLKRNFILK